MDYQCWNEAIFNYFFNKTVSEKEVLFCVDEDILLRIGETWQLDKTQIIDNFCETVSKQIISLNSKNKNIIRLNNIKLEIINNIPVQTAIIAFFILAASRMGRDKNITSRNYYSHLKSLSEKFYDISIQKGFRVNDKEKYFKIFSHFEDYVNISLNGKLGKIKFERLFQNEHRIRTDWIGIPIFQSMISHKDKALLTTEFAKARYEKIFIDDIAIDKFSHVFKTLSVNEKYKQILEDKINLLYKNWDGQVYDIDEKNNKEYFILTPKILYTKERFGYTFYEILKYNKALNEFKFNNINYTKSLDLENFYNPIPIEINNINLKGKKVNINDKYIIRYPERDFILLKKSELISGHYIECNTAEIGDTISIIGTPSFFKQNLQRINSITDKQINPVFIDDNIPDLMLLEKIKIIKEEHHFNIVTNDKISLKKGLKNRHKYEYLKYAEPLLFLTNNSSDILLSIDGESYETNQSKTIDLRKQHNSIGMHRIQRNNNNLKYKIIDKIDEQEFKPIFSWYNCSVNIVKSPTPDSSTPNLINGCYIENYTFKNNINATKIQAILNTIQKKRSKHAFIIKYDDNCNKLDKNFKNFALIDNIKLKYKRVLQETGNNDVS